MTTTVKANPKALEKALACSILAEAPGISIHTRAALRSISRRLIEVEAVSWEEFHRVAYAYFAVRPD
jgi:hypothetical protein